MSLAQRASQALLITAMVVAPFAFGGVEPWARNCLLIIISVGGALSLVAKRPAAYRPPRTASACIAIAMFGIGQCLSAQAFTNPQSIGLWTADGDATRRSVLTFAAFALGSIGFSLSFQSEQSKRQIAWFAVISSAAIALIGIAQSSEGNVAYYGIRLVRHGHPFGPFVNYNHAGTFMAMGGLLGLGLILEPRPLSVDELGRRIVLTGLSFLSFVGLIWSRSRLSLMSALIAIGVLLLWGRRWGRGGLIAVGIATTITIGVGLGPHHRFDPAGVMNSAHFRIDTYRAGLRLIRDFPLVGVGLGAFSTVFGAYQPSISDGKFEHLHNDYLELLSEIGVLGLLLGGLAFAWRKRRNIYPPVSSPLAVGAYASCAVILICSLGDFGFHIPANALMFVAAFSVANSEKMA